MSCPHLLIQFLQLPHIPPSHFHKVSLPQNCCHQHLQGQPVFQGADWLWAMLILLTPFCFWKHSLMITMAFPFLFLSPSIYSTVSSLSLLTAPCLLISLSGLEDPDTFSIYPSLSHMTTLSMSTHKTGHCQGNPDHLRKGNYWLT